MMSAILPGTDSLQRSRYVRECVRLISVVIPCFNEEEVFPELVRRLAAAAPSWGEPWEILFVNDGSEDATWEKIVAQHARDPRFKGINFTRNFGHQIAVSAGLGHAIGDCVVVMDADLQDPPEELARFIAKWKEGYEVVFAVRRKRKESVLKKIAYAGFYRVLAGIANIEIPLDSGDFCVMDRKVVQALNSMPERNRFVRGLRAWAGYRQTGLEYERSSRAAGAPKYTLWKLFKLAADGIFSFSTVPLRLATWLGLLVSFAAFIGIGLVIFQKIWPVTYGRWMGTPPEGFTTTLCVILFLGGVGLICLGIIGEYLGRIYEEVKHRPQWLVRDRIGLTDRPVPSANGSIAPPSDAAPAHQAAAPISRREPSAEPEVLSHPQPAVPAPESKHS